MRAVITISGDRSYDNYSELAIFCDKVLEQIEDVTIITGSNESTETNAQIYAANRGYRLKVIDGNSIDRHQELLCGSEILIAFWGGIDSDTKLLIDKAYWYGRKIKVLGYI
jgi:PP-loop superfamily ATP-utilizing enzyme